VVDDYNAVCDSTKVLLEALDFEIHIYKDAADFLAASPNIACLIAGSICQVLTALSLLPS